MDAYQRRLGELEPEVSSADLSSFILVLIELQAFDALFCLSAQTQSFESRGTADCEMGLLVDICRGCCTI